jgi:hypothetical protein
MIKYDVMIYEAAKTLWDAWWRGFLSDFFLFFFGV